MNVGFHHHVPSVFDSAGRVLVPAFFGVFIAELAKKAGSVTYYTFEGEPTGLEDYPLLEPDVTCVNLGRRPKAPVTLLRPGPIVAEVDFARDKLDVLLVRGPGPLLPALLRKARAASLPAAAFIMGDYRSWRPWSVNPSWRNQLIKLYARIYMRMQRRAVRDVLLFAHNPHIARATVGRADTGAEFGFTSWITSETLAEIDARRPAPSAGAGGRIRLLYTGRIVEEKGVTLIVEALAMLVRRGYEAELHFIGWSPPDDPTPRLIDETAARFGVADRVIQGGFRSAGAELLEVYLESDVYVTASPTEWGFPHTVLEAMAARVPVVASAIEGLRDALTNGEQAILVETGSAAALADGIARVLDDPDLRRRLTDAGRVFAEAHTNERSVDHVLQHLRRWADRARAGAS